MAPARSKIQQQRVVAGRFYQIMNVSGVAVVMAGTNRLEFVRAVAIAAHRSVQSGIELGLVAGEHLRVPAVDIGLKP